MVLHTRRDALKTLPALAVGLSGCSSLRGFTGDDDGLPTPTAWRTHLRKSTPGVEPPDSPLVFGSRSHHRDDPMIAGIDPETGEQRWGVSAEEGRSSPVGADEQFAYVFSKAEKVFAVDYRKGEIAWKTGIRALDRADPGAVQFAPVPAGESVVVPASGTEDDVPDRLVAFAAADGERRYSHDLPASIAGAPAADHGSGGEGDDGREVGVIVPLLDGTLRRVDASGTEQWKVEVGAPMSGVTVADGTAYVGSATEELLAFDAGTGDLRWRGALQNAVFTPPLVADGRVFVGGADYYLYAFDAQTGERRWRTETANAITSGPTLVGGTTMADGPTTDGGTTLPDAKLVTLVGGDVRQRGTSGTVPFSPTVLYVHDTDGTLVSEYRFEGYTDGGQVRWAAAIGDGVYLGQAYQLARLGEEVLEA
ncbi:outer membrane protein assembly factor BamB family protein [Halorussus ruber]|uniref:outer membrane protein assembly factor BamB family protein n=1 Tax=Halorussus ruber TaxID=1126238 RepID=UPI001091CDD2|nr:PQQ-binding-like beta-propeller repeat protein [Halorussus ruber]